MPTPDTSATARAVTFADRFLDHFVPRRDRADVSLARLSGDLGVGSVSASAQLGGHNGQVRWLERVPHIALAAGLPHEQRRWSWAHELAHVMVSRPDRYAAHIGRRLDTGGVAEEKLCDNIARALLMPYDTFSTMRFDQLDAAESLLVVARRYAVPPAAAAPYVWALLNIAPCLVSLHQSGPSWSADFVSGASFTSIRLAGHDAAQQLDRVAGAARPFRMEVTANVDDIDCVILLQGRPHDGEIWAEVKDLRRLPIPGFEEGSGPGYR